jgi:hypothetical protein
MLDNAWAEVRYRSLWQPSDNSRKYSAEIFGLTVDILDPLLFRLDLFGNA